MKLREWLPPDHDVPEKHLDAVVVEQRTWKWPGRERYVRHWVVLDNGRAIGWNENPSRGWSFPIIKWKETK